MVIAIIILSWLLFSAWVAAYVFAEDLGYSTAKDWWGLIKFLLIAPIDRFIILPIKLYLHYGKQKKKGE